jgi:APA family basic amino acid/polyamine antiporter
VNELRRPRGRLLQVLGLAFGLAVIVGNTIGAGILRAPGEVAGHLHGLGLFVGVWLAGGIYSLLGANSLAELGAMVPKSGGQYVFVRRALGPYPAFVVGWSDWISSSGAIAAVTVVIGGYCAELAAPLAGREVAVAAFVAIAFTLLQWRGIRVGDAAQQVSSLLKALVFIALIVACFVLPVHREALPHIAAPAAKSETLATAIVLALQAVIFTYDGWTGVLYFGEEVKEPGRDIPRAMIGGVLLVIAIYLLVNFAFLHVLGLERMAGDPFTAGSASLALFGERGRGLLHVVMILALLSSVNALLLLASRVPVAMSRDRLLPAMFCDVNLGGTPAPALFASASVALAFLFSGTFDAVIAVLAYFFIASYTLSFISVFVLRAREPAAPRPYRAWGHPWTTALALAGSIAFLIAAVANDWTNARVSLLLLVASYPVFWVSQRRSKSGAA